MHFGWLPMAYSIGRLVYPSIHSQALRSILDTSSYSVCSTSSLLVSLHLLFDE